MKINEIVSLPSQTQSGFDISDFDIENATQVGTAENIPIFHLKGGHKDPSLEAFSLKKEGKFISLIVGTWGQLNGKAFIIRRAFTDPQYRNKGLMTALYYALYTRLKIRLISDFEQSPETIAVWKKLATTLNIKVLNTHTNHLFNYEDVPKDDIFNKKNENIRLVLEMSIPDPSWILIPELCSGILRDYIHHTHPEFEGNRI